MGRQGLDSRFNGPDGILRTPEIEPLSVGRGNARERRLERGDKGGKLVFELLFLRNHNSPS